MDYSLEPVEERHRQPVIDLFNDYIRHSYAAFLSEPVDYQFFDQFLHLSAAIRPWR